MLFSLDFHHVQTNPTTDPECSGSTGFQRTHKTPQLIAAYLSALAQKFKVFVTAYRTATGYTLLPPLSITSRALVRNLRSVSVQHLALPSGTKSLLRMFLCNVP